MRQRTQTRHALIASALGAGLTVTSLPASAAPADDEAGTVEDGRRYSARGEAPNRDKWIYRWAPVNGMGELGVYGGVWFPSPHLELYGPNPDLPDEGWQQLRTVAGDVGLRGGYYPLRFLGVELEGGVMPSRTIDTEQPATAWTVRGHIVAQLGLWSITPFLLVGTGLLGMSGADAPSSLGSDQDVSIHFGGGAKFYINRWTQLRLDVRNVSSNRRGVGEGLTSSPEILLGLSVTLGRTKKKRARKGPGDRDGDGVFDREDFCPDQFGVPPRGCPTVCIDDNDADGLSNPEDKCPEQPETRNGFEDADGCPDEVPPELEDLAGVMEGINFDTDKDTIKSASMAELDNAVAVMKKYPKLRIRVVGHTDSQGSYTHNIELSRRRSKAVKTYLEGNGIDASRIETDGVGPDQPLAPNDSPEGRAKNRRIEFLILVEDGPVKSKSKP